MYEVFLFSIEAAIEILNAIIVVHDRHACDLLGMSQPNWSFILTTMKDKL